MNTERILQVADAIEQHSIPWLGFNMHNFIFSTANAEETGVQDHITHACDTVACIAGWTNAIRLNLSKKDAADPSLFSLEAAAAAWLGLSTRQAENLFYAHSHPLYEEHGSRMWKDIPADQAIRTLRHLAATGEVDWTA